MLLTRFSTDVSVRSRLIVLSLIPVVGFAAIALAYLSSERAVDTAFESVQQSSRLSEASCAFKEALTTMHMRAKDFVAQPQPGLVARFGEAHESAMTNLKAIGELVSDTERQNVTLLEGRVASLKTTFWALAAYGSGKLRLSPIQPPEPENWSWWKKLSAVNMHFLPSICVFHQ